MHLAHWQNTKGPFTRAIKNPTLHLKSPQKSQLKWLQKSPV